MEPRIVIMGPPGAGKGTQSEHLAEEFGVEHVATGDMLRENKDMETAYGTPREYMEAGELVPDEVMEAVVEEALSDLEGFVLDGYPRTQAQAEFLSGVTAVDVVLYLEVGEEELVRRLAGRRVCESCGATYHVDFDPPEEAGVCDDCGGDLYRREDDDPETVRTRIEEYESKTAPVVEFYRESSVPFVDVDGEGAPEEVWEQLREAVVEIKG